MTAADQNAERIFAQCEKEAKKYATQGGEEDKIAYLRHLEGLYRGVIRGLYIKLENFEAEINPEDIPVNVMFGDTPAIVCVDVHDYDEWRGVWINGADIMMALSDEQIKDIERQIDAQHTYLTSKSLDYRFDMEA